jgi:hypothetical protein
VAILSLTVALPLHILEHLQQKQTESSDDCPCCAWSRDTGAGLAATVALPSALAPAATLPPSSPRTPEHLLISAFSSRAPPCPARRIA